MKMEPNVPVSWKSSEPMDPPTSECMDIHLHQCADGSSHAIDGSNAKIYLYKSPEGIEAIQRDCSKVKSSIIVDYPWEKRYYSGRLIALHPDGDFVAYVLRGISNVVRVVRRTTKQRELVRGFNGFVVDIAWSSCRTIPLLGMVDQRGDVFVYQLLQLNNHSPTLFLHVRNTDAELSDNHQICWCPYAPEESIDDSELDLGGSASQMASDVDDPSKMMVVVHGRTVQLLNVEVARRIGVEMENENAISTSFTEDMDITVVTISPDSTALALGTKEGCVKFFVIDGDSVRCAHQWNPHDGKSVDTLIFLDNIYVSNADVQFWKYALTGSNDNKDLKLWACETWTCLQMIRFEPAFLPAPGPFLQICIDNTANYIAITDLERQVYFTFLALSQL